MFWRYNNLLKKMGVLIFTLQVYLKKRLANNKRANTNK